MLKSRLVKEFLNNVIDDEKNMCVVECLLNETNTDEEIAEETGIKLNLVRKVLYKLYDSGIASYKRSKDPETQWYTYSWKFDVDNINFQIETKYKNRISSLKALLEIEENNMFFVCESGHERFDFDSASDKGFVCPECGKEIKFEDNTTVVKGIKKEIALHEKTYNNLISNNAK
jgi:transcription initiation factor TFIIE subunit alpha